MRSVPDEYKGIASTKLLRLPGLARQVDLQSTLCELWSAPDEGFFAPYDFPVRRKTLQ
jgi:hypothetical protein